MENKLAIVLPAYKPDFLRSTLESIANQSDHRFTLYIGDDNSPVDLKNIVDEFSDSIDLVYHRFEDNLGQRDLVGHWKRCIKLTKGEEWVWLFADDDLMESSCVEMFYAYLSENADCDVVHFDTLIIDQTDKLLEIPKRFPERLAVRDFFHKRINYQVSSFAVEYIVRRSVYDQRGGFVNFDLAWCADDASWMNFGRLTSIKTIRGARVKWRNSGLNITALNEDKDMVYRKMRAQVAFINWATEFFRKSGIADATSVYQKSRWILDLPFHSGILGLKEKKDIVKEVAGALAIEPPSIRIWLYLVYCEAKCWVKRRFGLGAN